MRTALHPHFRAAQRAVDDWGNGICAPIGNLIAEYKSPAGVHCAQVGHHQHQLATGFTADGSWVDVPIFIGAGYPPIGWQHRGGRRLRVFRRFVGIGRDADFIAARLGESCQAYSRRRPAMA